MRRGAHAIIALALVTSVFAALPTTTPTTVAAPAATELFARTWARTDQPVAAGAVSRTWMSKFDNMLGSVSQVLAPKSASTLWAVHYHEVPGYRVKLRLDYDITHHGPSVAEPKTKIVWTAAGSVHAEVDVYEIEPPGIGWREYTAHYTSGAGNITQTNYDPDHASTTANDDQDCVGTWLTAGPSFTWWRYVDYATNTVLMGWGIDRYQYATYSGCPVVSDVTIFLSSIPIEFSLNVRTPQTITLTAEQIHRGALDVFADETPMMFTGSATWVVEVEVLGQ
jgi:hypothetical protein